MATTKTIPWGSDNPGNIELSADSWTGNQDVSVTSDENLGGVRSREIVFYSQNNGNIVSPPVKVSQAGATSVVKWGYAGSDLSTFPTIGGEGNLLTFTDVSSADHIKVEVNGLPDTWTITPIRVADPGVYSIIVTASKATETPVSGTIKITVGRLEPHIARFTQEAKKVVDTSYTRWSTIGAYAGYVPVSGFYSNSQIGAGGASWGCYLSRKGTPTRTRTDTYNNGDVVTTTEYMPSDTVIKGKVLYTASSSSERTVSASGQTTFGTLIAALPTVAGDVLFTATTLGTTFFDPDDPNGMSGYDGVAYALQVVDTELNEQYTIWTSIRDIPEQANKVVSYSTANASGTWGPIMTSGTGTTKLPSLGVQSYLWRVTAMFTGTFTSGAQGMVNAPSVRIVAETQGTPMGYEFILNTETDDIPEAAAAKPQPVNHGILCYGCGCTSNFLQCSVGDSAFARCRVEFRNHAGTVFHTIPSSRYRVATTMYPAEVCVQYITRNAWDEDPDTLKQNASRAPYIENVVDSDGGYNPAYGPSSHLWYKAARTYLGTGDDTEGGRLAPKLLGAQQIGQIPTYIESHKRYGWLMRLTEGAVINRGTAATQGILHVEMNINSTDRASWDVDVSSGKGKLFPVDPATGKVYAWIKKQLQITRDSTGAISRCSLRIHSTTLNSPTNIPKV